MRREVLTAVRMVASCAVMLVSLVFLSDGVGSADRRAAPDPDGPAAQSPPLADPQASLIEENTGQADPDVRFLARGAQYTALFRDRSVEVVPAAPAGSPEGMGAMRLSFDSAGDVAVGAGAASPRVHYFLGSDPAGWITDVRVFEAVAYRSTGAGIDLEVRADQDGLQLKWTLAPG